MPTRRTWFPYTGQRVSLRGCAGESKRGLMGLKGLRGLRGLKVCLSGRKLTTILSNFQTFKLTNLYWEGRSPMRPLRPKRTRGSASLAPRTSDGQAAADLRRSKHGRVAFVLWWFVRGGRLRSALRTMRLPMQGGREKNKFPPFPIFGGGWTVTVQILILHDGRRTRKGICS